MIFLIICSCDPIFRYHHHGELTFSMIYAYSEDFILTLSHDEVVHGKGSMIGKMPGKREMKFANLRAAYGFMLCPSGQEASVHGTGFRTVLPSGARRRAWSGICCSMMSIQQLQSYVKALLTALS